LAVEDFNGDGTDDLAIKKHYTRKGVSVIYGSTEGLTDVENQLVSRDEFRNMWVASRSTLHLNDGDDGEVFDVRTGHTIEVRLTGNSRMQIAWMFGYGWQIADVTGEAVVQDGPVRCESVGGGEYVFVFSFSAEELGSTTLNLGYLRPFTNDPIDTFTVHIDVASEPESSDHDRFGPHVVRDVPEALVSQQPIQLQPGGDAKAGVQAESVKQTPEVAVVDLVFSSANGRTATSDQLGSLLNLPVFRAAKPDNDSQAKQLALNINHSPFTDKFFDLLGMDF
jgi:hypothetical protein